MARVAVSPGRPQANVPTADGQNRFSATLDVAQPLTPLS